MIEYSIAHEFATEPATFWRLFLDEGFNRDLYARTASQRALLELVEERDTVRFRQRVVPRRRFPPLVRRALGGDLAYVEHSTLYRSHDTVETVIEPSLLSGRITMIGRMTLRRLGASGVRRTLTGSVRVALPVVGSAIERSILEQLESASAVAAEVTRRWLQDEARG
jgi:hypothetical protein